MGVLLQPEGRARLDVLRRIDHLQQGHGDGPLLPVQIIAEGFPCQALPIVVHRQAGDLLQVPGQVQGTADGEVGTGHPRRVLAGHIGGFNDRQQGIQVTGARHHARQRLGRAGLDIALEARLPLLAHRPIKQLIQASGQGLHPWRKVRHIAGGIQLGAPIAQEPARGAPTQAHQLVHQGQLQLGRHLIIQGLDLLPPVR